MRVKEGLTVSEGGSENEDGSESVDEIRDILISHDRNPIQSDPILSISTYDSMTRHNAILEAEIAALVPD